MDNKEAYLAYRRVKSGEFGPSAEMLAKINALDSKLATRGRIEPNMANKNIVRNIKLQKHAQTFENRVMATQALKSFLESRKNIQTSVITPSLATALKAELELLAAYFLASTMGVKWIPGPLKKLDKSMGKTIVDYDYAWGSNKDLVRGTLACQSNESLKAVASLVKVTCTNELGMFLLKQDKQESTRDGGNSESGYSGWNFVIQFKDHKQFGAEVQANTFDMMYGKMSKKDFCDILKCTESEHNAIQSRLMFPGGLGHGLYDIQDVARSKVTMQEGDLARELSLDYNDACRGQFRKTTLQDLNRRIIQFGSSLTSTNAKDLWKHAVDGRVLAL